MSVEDYVRTIIEQGDKGSQLLAMMSAPTLQGREFVDVLSYGKNGLVVIRPPSEHHAVVHSAGGNPLITDLRAYAASSVDRAVAQARAIGADPVAFANVIDSSTGDLEMLKMVMEGLVERADHYKLAIVNGENAILGKRITGDANVTVTMVSAKSGKLVHPSWIIQGSTAYARFNPAGLPLYMNSDGVGTKTEFYERLSELFPQSFALPRAVHDFLAMNADDGIKKGAIARAISGIVETRGVVDVDAIFTGLSKLAAGMDILGILGDERMDHRLMGWREQAIAYNMSGSLVSTIDEHRLRNPLVPQSGEYLIAIQKKEGNPRSNGMTAKRNMMVKRFGDNWHFGDDGHDMLKYLAEPSAVLYPVFKELVERGSASSIYHMSGGAFNGKLAAPLAAHGLFAAIEPFLPDSREEKLARLTGDIAACYATWPMGNDGFVTTDNPWPAIGIIERMGYKARVVGRLETGDRTGVEITGLDRQKVYFSGK